MHHYVTCHWIYIYELVKIATCDVNTSHDVNSNYVNSQVVIPGPVALRTYITLDGC